MLYYDKFKLFASCYILSNIGVLVINSMNWTNYIPDPGAQLFCRRYPVITATLVSCAWTLYKAPPKTFYQKKRTEWLEENPINKP